MTNLQPPDIRTGLLPRQTLGRKQGRRMARRAEGVYGPHSAPVRVPHATHFLHPGLTNCAQLMSVASQSRWILNSVFGYLIVGIRECLLTAGGPGRMKEEVTRDHPTAGAMPYLRATVLM